MVRISRPLLLILALLAVMLIGLALIRQYSRENKDNLHSTVPAGAVMSDGQPEAVDWHISPVDLSFLNAREKPAGKHGFVQARGESLYFADGTQVHFWGANLTARSLFESSDEAIRQQSRRLSALGFNLVRIHHHDSFWLNPNIFGKSAQTTNRLDPESLRKLDWWIKCLKDEGIYVWLDLHVERGLTVHDGIQDIDEIRKSGKSANLKGYNYVNDSILQAMERFNSDYLNHVNPYTRVAYKNEPAIAALLITNENDVTNHFGNLLLPDKGVPEHARRYMQLAENFARKYNLPEGETWRAWQNGPAKIFLNDLQHRFDAEMLHHLRKLGVRIPVATTSMWGDNDFASLPALTAGDIVDAHAYGGADELGRNPLHEFNMASWLAMTQIADKPFSVSEWNVSPFPVADRHDIPLWMAATARRQGWDAVMIFAYAHDVLDLPGRPSNWQAYNDPSLLSTLPAAALLYRQGHVAEAASIYALTPDADQLFYHPWSAMNLETARAAAESGKLVVVLPPVKQLPWLQAGKVPAHAELISSPAHKLQVKAEQGEAAETNHNWQQHVYTINSALTQAALGNIGGREIALRDVDLKLEDGNYAVAVQSLDGKAIHESSKLMISLGAQSVPAGNSLPFIMQGVTGRISLSARPGLKAFSRDFQGRRKQIPSKYTDGRYVITLQKAYACGWIFIEK